jgi:hypothetical protein
MTIPKSPNQEGIDPLEKCIEFSNKSAVHIQDHGVGATFQNPRGKQVRIVRYDQCYNRKPHVRQADFVVGMPEVVDVIVELKGSDLKHAVTQVAATLEAWSITPIRFPRTACLIVYGRMEAKQKRAGAIPRMDSRTGSIERRFLLEHKTLLWVRESGSEKFRFNDFLRKSDAR